MNKPTAKLSRATGSVRLDIPIVVDGVTKNLAISVQLLEAPTKALTACEDCRSTIETAIFDALTNDISTNLAGREAMLPLHKLVTAVIDHKVNTPQGGKKKNVD